MALNVTAFVSLATGISAAARPTFQSRSSTISGRGQYAFSVFISANGVFANMYRSNSTDQFSI